MPSDNNTAVIPPIETPILEDSYQENKINKDEKEEEKELVNDDEKQELDKIFSSPNFDYGIKLIRDLNLEKPLEINTYNLRKTTYLVGIWAQLDCKKYPFNKSEKETIKKVRKLLNLDVLSKNNLYKYVQNYHVHIQQLNRHL